MATGLVLLMVPGLALFYGGMVRRKNVLGTMMHSMVALALIGVQWLLFGYALAFGESHGGLIGWSSSYLGLSGVWSDDIFPGTHIPIFSPERIVHTKPDYILILPWNLKDEIAAQLGYTRDWGARLVIPIPEVSVI